MSTRLSKSRFQKGLRCDRALWLEVHARDAADPVTEARQWIFDQGTRVGRLAHGLFPGGVEVTEDHLHSEEALATTARLLEEGARVLYEPAFTFDGVLVRVDVLVAAEPEVEQGADSSLAPGSTAASGGRVFDLYEVKSSSRLKDEHVTDAAIQTYVVEGAGIRIRRCSIVHLDTSYVYEGDGYDVSRLFAIEDVTQQARAFMPLVHDTLEAFRRMLDEPEPTTPIGTQCHKPYDCDYITRCHSFLPARYPVTELPRISQDVLHGLLDRGIACILDVPDLYGPLTPAQRSTVRVIKSGVPDVDVSGLKEDLAKLTYPIHHLDFETVMPALPLWAETRPYEVVPFQYSVRIEHADGALEHREYLQTSGTDPRRPLAERLLQDLGERGSVTHYSAYERRILDGLATAMPDLASRVEAVKARMFDLRAVVRSRTRHPDANGSTSIKSVLPAWCDDVSYGELGIQDGEVASVRYLKAITGQLDETASQLVFDELFEYCGTDTLAMVRLLAALRELVPTHA